MNSFWLSSTQKYTANKSIDNDYTADVCVVGAGISGLSTAYYLAQQGFKVIIVDKEGIGEKTSGHTTAKITLQHGLIYNYLINSFGVEFALGYFQSNKQAISNIKKIIDSENIDCDFEYQNNYIYTTRDDDVSKIKNEIKALNTLDELKDDFINNKTQKNSDSFAHFITNCELPFKVVGSVQIKNQAQFHPRKYMLGLARSIQNYGGLIFTNSIVQDIQKNDDGFITFVKDYTINSKYVVLASHYPFINIPGFYFSKMYQATSYAIAIETNNSLFDGMYINTGEPVYSFRSIPYGEKRLLIISGGNHKTGYSPDSESSYGYSLLENEAKKLYPDSKILYKWNTRDCITLDKIPYIGEFSKVMPNMFVATGFNKWGMTSSNVAAKIISDKICGIENKYEFVYNSSRFNPVKNRGEVKNMAKQIFHSFVSSRLKIPSDSLSAIKHENGGILKIDGNTVGIYKNSEGKVFAVDPTCTHLGCLLTWNNLDKTWDCPCHGSRFDYTGKNLYDPAFKDLNTYDI